MNGLRLPCSLATPLLATTIPLRATTTEGKLLVCVGVEPLHRPAVILRNFLVILIQKHNLTTLHSYFLETKITQELLIDVWSHPESNWGYGSQNPM